MAPFISVIVVAHNRRQYLKRAIGSVVNQTLSKKQYEIIVVKNFKDRGIDGYIRRAGARSVVTKDQPLGSDYAVGIKVSRGEVVAFLEDDDYFDRRKLAKVYNTFKNPDICYYHNAITHVYSNGKRIGNERPGSSRYGLISSRFGDPARYDRGGMSAIAVSAELAKRHASKIKGVPFNLENFLFFLMRASDMLLYFDSERLTYYTVHGVSMTNPTYDSYEEYRKKKMEFLKTDLMVFDRIAKAVGRADVDRGARFELSYHKAAINLLNDHEVYALGLSDYIRLFQISIPIALAAVAHIVLPRTVSRMYYRRERAMVLKA